jgi:hypothetical protein
MWKWNDFGRTLVPTAIAGARARLGIRDSATGKTASQCTARVERLFSRRRTPSIWLGASSTREERGYRAGRRGLQRTPLTTRANLRTTKTARPMAAASVAKRKAVRARTGGLGRRGASSPEAGDSRVSFSASSVGCKPTRFSCACTGTRDTSIGFQSPKRSPARANAPSSSATAAEPTRRTLRTRASRVYLDSRARSTKPVSANGQ